jgi:ATP/maltotriose-dependent transcriptional regulator MalT/DNA-binding SARP family transcriptional activator
MPHFHHKIIVPRRPSSLVRRERLIALLGAITDRRLITLSAPAGYGKTSLLTDFASAGPPLPVCWYTLDRFDEDPWVFLGYLAAAVEQRFPGATQQTTALLAGRAGNPFSTVAAALVRDMYAVGDDFALLIDDWHLVDHVADIKEVVAQLLLQCPNVHLILASRTYPSLPDMMLLAARRQMSGLDEEQLRFTAPELAAALGTEYHTTIPLAQAVALADQSNGWITGALLAFQITGPDALAPALDGARAERQIYDFLAEQVFDRQTSEVRAFLLQSSLLEELTPPMCDELLGRGDSGRLLQTLLRQHLFVSEIKLGELRYNPLFREFLQKHFRTAEPQHFRDTALRVAAGYSAQSEWALAFELYIAAGDLRAAQGVVAAGGDQLLTSGRLEMLEHWFALLPLDDLDTALLCLKARLLLDRGQTYAAQALAELAYARMRPDEESVVGLLQAQIARLGGQYDDAIAIARRVQRGTSDIAQRATALRIEAICKHRLGQPAEALADLQAALALERQRGDLFAIALLQHDLGVCYEEAGQLHQATECYSHADAYWAMIGNMGRRGLSLNSKGVVQHLMGHYRDAHTTLQLALQHAEEASVPDYEATALTSLGDLLGDLQLWTRAADAYAEARKRGGSAYLLTYLELAEIRLAVQQRHYETAGRTLQALPHAIRGHHSIAVQILQSAVACGMRDYDHALCQARRVIEELDEQRKPLDVARAHLLRAWAIASQTPIDSAALIEALDHATQIADRLGYDAFLVAETLHMPNLLRRAYAAGWVRAADWLQRHGEMLAVAQSIRHDESRPLMVVRTLGLDQITLNGAPLDLGWLKAREVFYYLLQHPDGAAIDELREAIWPELGRESSRNALKTAIYQLRTALPRELITLHGRQTYLLNRAVVDIDYDVERFLEDLDPRASDADAIFEAMELYRGRYLPWSDNEWSNRVRMDLEERYLRALRMSAERYEHALAHLDALALHRRLLAIDPLDEAAHAGVMRCQIALGNRAAAIAQYQALRRILDEELGLELGRASEVEQLYHSILMAS